ncbi:MAG: three-Cys-motif partner protein TcmP [Phycisphaerales bacterium]|nr:three-Cys-motif partner protein TcmP [Phycisphaerales bacterium]
MSEPKETIYAAEPHTQAKHDILREYLKRWLPILARQSETIGRTNGRLLYVDGFAGAGEYTDNIPGSPIVAIQTALNHSHSSGVPVQIKFIEIRQDRVLHLRKLIDQMQPELTKSGSIVVDEPIKGDCEEIVIGIIDDHENCRKRLGPALFFLDQFGYSSFSMQLIGRILKNEVCEVFSYLNWNLLHPFMADQTKHAGITKAFGGEEWKEVMELRGKEKEDRFRDIYITALQQRAGATYAYPFAMRNRDDRVIYWLFFCSNNLRGLEEMKRAMWKVDRSGGFEFSDRHAQSAGNLFKYTDEDLANDLIEAMDGQTPTVGEIEEYVLVNTPAYLYKGALGILERTGRLKPIDPPKGRRAAAFNDKGLRVQLVRTVQTENPTLFDY